MFSAGDCQGISSSRQPVQLEAKVLARASSIRPSVHVKHLEWKSGNEAIEWPMRDLPSPEVASVEAVKLKRRFPTTMSQTTRARPPPKEIYFGATRLKVSEQKRGN